MARAAQLVRSATLRRALELGTPFGTEVDVRDLRCTNGSLAGRAKAATNSKQGDSQMSNNNRGSRAALAAMVVAVMAMSAVSAEAAANRAPAKKSGATVQILKRAVASLLVR